MRILYQFFTLLNLIHTITTKGGNEFLAFAQGGSIKRLSLPYLLNSYGYLHTNYYKDLVAVSYDCKERKVYWTDATDGFITRSNYDGSELEVVFSGLGSPEGITVDPYSRLIFWTDSRRQSISVGSLTGNTSRVLFDTGIVRPRAIVCYPFTGRIYWTDWNRRGAKIESASMDGSDRQLLVQSKFLSLPNGIAINYALEELCWTDSGLGQITCMTLDGFKTTRRLVEQAVYPFSLTFHRGILYYTDWTEEKILKRSSDDNEGEVVEKLSTGHGYDGRIYDITAVTPCSSRSTICEINNGGCAHHELCLMRDSARRVCATSDSLITRDATSPEVPAASPETQPSAEDSNNQIPGNDV